jgi:hypothetical protein
MTTWSALLMTAVGTIWIAMLSAVAYRVRTVDAGERT